MRKRIGLKIFIMLAIMIAASVVSSAVSFRAMNSMNKVSEEISDKYIAGIQNIGSLAAALEREQKFVNLLSSSAADELYEQIFKSLADTRQEITGYLEKTEEIINYVGSSDMTGSFNEVKSQHDKFISISNEIIDLYKSGKKQLSAEKSATELVSVIDGISEAVNKAQTSFAKIADEKQLEQTSEYDKGTAIISDMLLINIAIAIIILAIIIFTIVMPAKNASREIKRLIADIDAGKGDLTKRVKVRTKDEVGQMTEGINNLIECLQNILRSIQNETANLEISVKEIEDKVHISDTNINEASSTTQELAASMEEVTSTLAQINENTAEILEAADIMNERALEGSEMAEAIKETAGQMNDNAQSSKSLTDQKVNNIYSELQEALENSKSVDKINELTGQILDIAGQTNLLALNASIEAARAGEAGKGFAVVADEIRVLADTSRNTANNIQEISGLVIEAVEQLTRNAENMIEFVSVTVLGDYEEFVKSTTEYKRDAENINAIINEFAISSGELKKTMETVNSALDGISSTVDVSAQGVTNVADNANDLVDAISQILNQVEGNKAIADKLMKETGKFSSI